MNNRQLLLALIMSGMLAACGSSSSSDDPPPAGNGDQSSSDSSASSESSESSASSASSEPEAPTTVGLVAHYQFQDDLTDSTGHFADGSVTGNRADNPDGGSISYAAGAFDGSTALVLDGTSGVRLADGLIGPGAYTISIWLHPDQISQFTTAFFGARTNDSWISLTPAGPSDPDDPEDPGYTMFWYGSDLGTGWFDGTIGERIPVGAWSHVVASVTNERDIAVYIDGEERFTDSNVPNVFSSEDAIFALGVNFWDTPYVGLIDDLRIYDVALEAEEVAALFAGEEIEVGGDPVEEPPEDDDDANGDDDDANGDDNGLSVGLVAHYAFEDDLSDSTESQSAGIVTGDRPDNDTGAITYAAGVSGSAAAFDGSSGIRLPDGLIDSFTYSVSVWVNPTQLTDFASVFFGDDRAGNWVSIIPQGPDHLPGFEGPETMLRAVYNDAWYEGGTGALIAVGEWSHIVFTVNNGQVDTYINGENLRSDGNFADIFDNIGHEDGGIFTLAVTWWDAPFTGLLDELRIYDRALAAEEVAILAGEGSD